ncbi:MotA/TolQ/ExbB proton channel family protein, partial [Pseudomonas neuropathica]
YSLAQKNAFRVLLHPVLSKSGATVAGQKVKEAS